MLKDLCRCGSGKRYNECCVKRPYLRQFQLQGLEFFDEKYILQAVMNNDKKFKKFYREKRSDINLDINWFRGINWRSSMSYGFHDVNINYKIAFIVNKANAPIEADKGIEVAHEMQHIICAQEGYKHIDFKEEYKNQDNKICKVISDMLNDPIVNGEIKDYGFDLSKYYRKADEIQTRTIGIHAIENIPFSEKIFITTLYVKKTLDLRNVYPNINAEDIEFNQWIKQNYPEVIPTSKTILNFVEEIGFDTPEKVQDIFKKTIDILNLNDKLIISEV